MKDYRLYLFPISWIFFAIVAFYLFLYHWIISLIFTVILIVNIKATIKTYFHFLWWQYETWIDTSVVDIQKVKVPSTIEGKYLNGVIIRGKNWDFNKKHVGILFHHGFSGMKERNYVWTIPLALNGFTVLAVDARGHGESIDKSFKRIDIIGILSDVKNEIDFLEKLEDVDPDKLIMMGHSMGCIATLTSGYQDKRLKKIVGISGFYDILESFKKYHHILYKLINKIGPKKVGMSMEEWNRKTSAKFYFEKGHHIPDKDRVYLVHSKQDDLVAFENSSKIKEVLNLPDENVLFLEMPKRKYLMSAHRLIGQSTIVSNFLVKVAKTLEA
ncbi:MAG: alpha/beta hydrolase family protein [Promethearchaeota archaeon]